MNKEERFRLLIESTRDYAIFFLDIDNRVIDWNIGAERITGYSEAEMVGQLGSVIFTFEDIAARAPEQELQKARDEGHAENERWHVRKDGSRFWGSGIVTPLRDQSGTLIGYAKMMRDSTERRCMQEEREHLLLREQQAHREAETAKQAREKFIGVMAHELRSPLQSIVGWADLLSRRDLDEEVEKRAIETIQRNAALQSHMINDLLDITRIEAGTFELNLSPVCLEDTVDAVIDNIRPAADEKELRLTKFISPDLVPIQGDAQRLQQVIANLLNNAVKFSPPGKTIEVRVERSGEEEAITVIDGGIGIAAEFLPHVFDPYTQAVKAPQNEQHGLGLGLSIVRELVELHGGTIKAQSEGEGKGATFTVRLPVSNVSDTP